MKVFLISHTKAPENLVASAAKLCYSSASVEQILEKNLDQEKSQKFVEMLAYKCHESPLEHVTYTFGIEEVSRALLSQLTRHRIASYSVQSQRYVLENCFTYITPPAIEKNEIAKKRFFESMKRSQEEYSEILNVLKEEYFKKHVEKGLNEKEAKSKAEKEAAEDARFVLPNACSTKLILTMNARSLLNFFKLRCCKRAQWEIRNLACEMLRLVSKTAPSIFKNAGPGCVVGSCSEGNFSCGQSLIVKQKIAELKN